MLDINHQIEGNIRFSQELRVKLKDIRSTMKIEIQNELAKQLIDMSDPVQRQQAAEYEAQLAQEARMKNIKDVYGDINFDDTPADSHDPNVS